MNRPSLGQTGSTWLEVEVWERRRVDLEYVKDQCSTSIIVEAGSSWKCIFPSKNKTLERVMVILNQNFTRFGMTKTLVSANSPGKWWS